MGRPKKDKTAVINKPSDENAEGKPPEKAKPSAPVAQKTKDSYRIELEEFVMYVERVSPRKWETIVFDKRNDTAYNQLAFAYDDDMNNKYSTTAEKAAEAGLKRLKDILEKTVTKIGSIDLSQLRTQEEE